jgi:hypothetical protein
LTRTTRPGQRNRARRRAMRPPPRVRHVPGASAATHRPARPRSALAHHTPARAPSPAASLTCRCGTGTPPRTRPLIFLILLHPPIVVLPDWSFPRELALGCCQLHHHHIILFSTAWGRPTLSRCRSSGCRRPATPPPRQTIGRRRRRLGRPSPTSRRLQPARLRRW